MIELKSFDLLQIQMRWLGILPWSTNQNGKAMHLCQTGIIFSFIVEFFLSSFWYFAFTANTLNEYAESFYVFTFGIVIINWYVTYLWHRDNYCVMFLDFEKIAKKSKQNTRVANCSFDQTFNAIDFTGSENSASKLIYQHTDSNVENIGNILNILMFHVTVPLFCLSPILVTLLKYEFSNHFTDVYLQILPAT